MSKSDDLLIHQALSSDDRGKIEQIYESIYNDYVKLVAFKIAQFVDDREDIKDLTNEVFMRFYNHIADVNCSIKYYLMTIAKNVALDYLKKARRFERLEDEDSLSNFEQPSSFYIELIADMQRVLSEREVKIILLHVVDGWSFKDISEQLGMTFKNANTIYLRAIKKYQKASKRGRK